MNVGGNYSTENVIDLLSDLHFPALGTCAHNSEKSALMKAIEQANEKEVCTLLKSKKTCVLCRDSDGNTALHWAARMGNVVAIGRLADRGVILQARNNSGRTALFSAAEGAHAAAITMLVKLGLSVCVKEPCNEQTAIFYIGSSGDNASQILALQALIALKADVNASGWAGITPLINCCNKRLEHLVGPLLEAGANPRARSDYNKLTPLGITVGQNMLATTSLLLARGADKDDEGTLKLAIQNCNLQMLQLLLEAGVAVSEHHIDQAIQIGDIEIVRTLRAKGLSSRCTISEHDSDIYWGYWHKIKAALIGGRVPTYKAVELFICKATEEIALLGLERITLDASGHELLNKAARHNKPKVIKWLLGHGVNMYSESGDIPALLHGVSSGNVESLSLLLDHGARLNMMPQKSDNELIRSIRLPDTAVAQFILEKGLPTDTLEHVGAGKRRAIDVALGLRKKQHIKILLEKGANIDRPYVSEKGPETSTVRELLNKHFPDLLPSA